MRVVLGIATVAAALAAAERPAAACSCLPILQVRPADGEIDVPRNVQVVVVNGAGNYAVTGPDGPVSIADVATLVDVGVHVIESIRLAAPLDPSTDYTVTSNGASLVQFRTGLDEDHTPPAEIGFDGLRLAQADVAVSFSCGQEFWDVDPSVDVPDDAVAVLIASIRLGDRESFAVLAEEADELAQFSSGCQQAIPLLPGDEYTLELTAIDAAGNPGPTASRSATVIACTDIEDPETFGGSLFRCVPEEEGGGEEAGCCSSGGGGATGAAALALLALTGARRRTGSRRPARGS